MNNSYICINGCKTALTDEQLKELGFAFPRTIEDYTIKEISEIVRAGKAREYFKVHDIIRYEDYELEVIGFDHDKDADNPDAPTMTVMAKKLITDRRMNDGSCKRGWIDTELRAWLNETFIDNLSAELCNLIRPIRKVTHDSEGNAYETVDKLFLPSESELLGSAYWSRCEDGERYEAFATSEDRIRLDADGDGSWYWNRSSTSGSAADFCYVDGGDAGYSGASNAFGVPLCFSL